MGRIKSLGGLDLPVDCSLEIPGLEEDIGACASVTTKPRKF